MFGTLSHQKRRRNATKFLQVEASRASSQTTAAVCSSASPELPAELRSEDGTDGVRQENSVVTCQVTGLERYTVNISC